MTKREIVETLEEILELDPQEMRYGIRSLAKTLAGELAMRDTMSLRRMTQKLRTPSSERSGTTTGSSPSTTGSTS
jgi:hypothetical protein